MPLGQYTYHYGHCYNVHHHNGGPTQCGGHICPQPQLLRSLQQCTPSHRRSSQITATAYGPRLCLKIEYKSDHRASLVLSHTSCLSPSLERRPSFTLPAHPLLGSHVPTYDEWKSARGVNWRYHAVNPVSPTQTRDRQQPLKHWLAILARRRRATRHARARRPRARGTSAYLADWALYHIVRAL